MPCSHGDAGNGGGRCCQRQCTGARSYKYREHGLSIVGDEPGYRSNQQYQHQILTGIAFQQPCNRGFGALGTLHKADHFAQC